MEQTILDRFIYWENNQPNMPFLRQPFNSSLLEYSWKDVGTKARKIVSALEKRGLKKGDRIAILSANCAQRIISFITILLRKEEIFVGGTEGITLWLQRAFPWMLRRFIRNHPLKKMRAIQKRFLFWKGKSST